jgi:hypothetical protein
MDSYHRVYPYIAKLHMLRELEQAYLLHTERNNVALREEILDEWDVRLKITQPSFKIRAIFKVSLKTHIGFILGAIVEPSKGHI